MLMHITQTVEGLTALHVAAQFGHNKVVMALLDSKAVIDEKMNDGATALFAAAQNGHNEVVTALLKGKAAIGEKMNDGGTALHTAAQFGHTDVVTTLLKNNASIDLKRNDGVTALDLAKLNGHAGIVAALEAEQARRNRASTQRVSSAGATPFGWDRLCQLAAQAVSPAVAATPAAPAAAPPRNEYFGDLFGACKECECKEYRRPHGDRVRCDACDCAPLKHQKLAPVKR